MSAIKLMQQIQEVLAGYDAKVLQSLIDSIPRRREALKALSDRRAEFAGKYATTNYAYAQIEAAGGKGWLEMLRGCNNAMVIERVTKQEAAKAEVRAAKIAAKLNKAGITEVTDGEAAHTTDGFNGYWKVMTDKGAKTVKLEVIGAGGYNIQCYHYRVLVNIR